MLPESLEETYEYQFEGANFEELNLLGSDMGSLNALWFKTESPKGMVLYFHGNAGNLSRWGNVHEVFTRAGYDVLIYDYRGYGKSTGDLDEKMFYDDAETVLSFAKQHFSEDEIIIYGRSLGS